VSDVQTVTAIEDMKDPFLVTRGMAVALCDAVLGGSLPSVALETIGFALVASDNFYWDEEDNALAETLYDWSCPAINYPLTLENVAMFKSRLEAPA